MRYYDDDELMFQVTVSLLVICLLVCQSSQFPDHNRTRRDDKPSIISKPNFSIDDFQGWLTAVTNVMNSMNIPGASKGKPDQGDDKTNKDKHEDNHGDKDKE